MNMKRMRGDTDLVLLIIVGVVSFDLVIILTLPLMTLLCKDSLLQIIYIGLYLITIWFNTPEYPEDEKYHWKQFSKIENDAVALQIYQFKHLYFHLVKCVHILISSSH